MTCTVAHTDGNAVVIATDSAGTDSDGTLVVRSAGSKSWKVPDQDVLVGFSGDFSVGNWIRHGFEWPRRPQYMDAHRWLVAHVHVRLRKSLLKRFGDEVIKEADWSLVVGVPRPGRLFVMYACGDVEETSKAYTAIGAGAQLALGCLAALEGCGLPCWERLETAVRVSEQFHASVRGPVHMLAL